MSTARNLPKATLLAALLACTAPAALLAETPADTLVMADAIDDIVSIDPAEAFEFSGTDLNNNTYDTLVELDPTKPGELVPGLAESWSLAEDGVTYAFKMKPGVTFSSGNPVTAEDAALSLRRVVMLDKSPAFILTQFGLSKENIEQTVTFDGDTVTIKTDKPYAPSFVYNCLTAGVANIVDMKTVMANEVNGDMGNEWLKSNSAGTGAYVLKSFKPNEGYILEARAGHWRGDAPIKNVLMRHIPEGATQRLLIEKGDIDIGREMTPTDVAGEPRYRGAKRCRRAALLSGDEPEESRTGQPQGAGGDALGGRLRRHDQHPAQGAMGGASGLPAQGLPRGARRYAL